MYLEYSALLREAVKSFSDNEPASDHPFPWRWPHVIDCPRCETSIIGSGVAFELATDSEDGDPRTVAQQILQRCGELQAIYGELFTLRIGGQGYLNANITELFYQRFLAKLIDDSVAHLLSPESFVTELPTSREKVRTRPQFSGEQGLVKVLATLRSKNAETDTISFVMKCYDNGSRDTPERDRMMALALGGCEDISLRSYQLGLFGRENVPWYLNRFLGDSARFAHELSDSNPRPWELMYSRELPSELHKVMWMLFCFRQQLFRALERDDQAGLLSQALELARGFYGYYNNPTYRQASFPRIIQLREITTLLNALVRQLLALLEFPCTEHGLALEM